MNNHEPRVVAALPSGGWRVTRTYDDGAVVSTPIVAWLVFADGSVEPVDTDSTGYVMKISDETPKGYKLTVAHPDETVTQPASDQPQSHSRDLETPRR